MRRLGKESFRLLRGQRGFTLLEVVVAVGIIAFIGVGVVAALGSNYTSGRIHDEQVTARNLITACIEAVRAVPLTVEGGLPLAADYQDAVVDIALPPQYHVEITTKCTNNADDTESYSECTGNETFQKIIISVSREDGKHILSTCVFRSKRYE